MRDNSNHCVATEGIRLRQTATVERVEALAAVWGQTPEQTLEQLCCFGLHNHEDVVDFIEQR